MKSKLTFIEGRKPKSPPPKRSILNRLFDIREEVEQSLGRRDGLFTLIDAAVQVASMWEAEGMIPKQQHAEDPPPPF